MFLFRQDLGQSLVGGKKFYMITPYKKYELYEAVTFNLKNKDKDYKIYSLKGLMAYDNKLNEAFQELT